MTAIEYGLIAALIAVFGFTAYTSTHNSQPARTQMVCDHYTEITK